jgi:hypothetical protein
MIATKEKNTKPASAPRLRTIDFLEDELESIAEQIDASLADIRPACIHIEMNAPNAVVERPIQIILDRLNDLAHQAAWIRKFARERKQYEPLEKKTAKK